MAPIWAPKIIFLGEFECFLSYLSIWRPKNNFLPPKKFESHRVSLSLNFETRQLVFLGLRDKLVELVDKPYMARSNEALEMEGKIAALDQKQREHAAMILALSEQLVELKSEKATLVKYKASLFKKRNTLTKKLGAEIKEIDKQLQENGKKAKKTWFSSKAVAGKPGKDCACNPRFGRPNV